MSSKAPEILAALVEGKVEDATALVKQHLTESSSELMAAGTQYILQTAIDAYTDGSADGDLNESEEEEEEEEEEEK